MQAGPVFDLPQVRIHRSPHVPGDPSALDLTWAQVASDARQRALTELRSVEFMPVRAGGFSCRRNIA